MLFVPEQIAMSMSFTISSFRRQPGLFQEQIATSTTSHRFRHPIGRLLSSGTDLNVESLRFSHSSRQHGLFQNRLRMSTTFTISSSQGQDRRAERRGNAVEFIGPPWAWNCVMAAGVGQGRFAAAAWGERSHLPYETRGVSLS